MVNATGGTANPANVALDVAITGGGSGTVTSEPSGIDGPATCSFDFAPDARVRRTATPGANGAFVGWSGDCSGSSTTYDLTMISNESCIAELEDTSDIDEYALGTERAARRSRARPNATRRSLGASAAGFARPTVFARLGRQAKTRSDR